MNFGDAIKKLQDFLNKENYNILGYPYDPKTLKKMEPWFYMHKDKLGLPPACNEWMDMLKQKYTIAAQLKKKVLGQWAGPYYFFAIKADGLDVAAAEAKKKEMVADVEKRMETIYADKKTNAYELKSNMSIPVYVLAYIWENSVPDALYQSVLELGKNRDGNGLILLIDLANKRCDRGENKQNIYMGTPNPKDIVKLIS